MGETLREGSGETGSASQATGGTWREGVAAGVAGSVAGVSLLPCLVDRFVVVDRLLSGGEADVLLVADGAGERWVVKQYRQPGWSPAEDVLSLLEGLKAGRSRRSWASDERTRHLVWVDEWGVDPSSGLFFEVQEFLEGGALAGVDGTGGSWSRLRQWPVDVFAGALIDAVAGFHSVVGAHRDVKPGNVLVRSVDPLVLVAGDVGLSRSLVDGSVRWTVLGGSPPYQAPEAALGKVSQAGDWWSVGVMIAQAVLGRHPLALEDGSLPEDRVVSTAVAERGISLERVSDPRLRLLCQGLLTKDSERRWGLPQIAQWRAGGSPVTGFADAGPAESGSRVRRVRFAGADYDTPAGLAAALAADPDRAARELFLSRDSVLDSQLRAMLRAHSLSEALSELDSYRSGAWQPVFLRLLAEMDPGLSPELAGQSMTPEAVAQIAQQVIAAGRASAEQSRVLQWVVEHDVWRWWWELPGMGDAAQAAERMPRPADVLGSWYGEVIVVDGKGVCRRRRSSGADVSVVLSAEVIDRYWTGVKPVISAWLVLAAVDADQVEQELRRVIQAERDRFTRQQWWLDLADGPIVDALTAVTATGLAQQASVALHEQLEAKRREEARLATEAENAEARRARELQIAAARRARELQIAAEVKRRYRLDKGIAFTWSIALGLCILSWPLGIAMAKRIGWGCHNAWDCSPSYDAGVEGDRINTEFQAVVVVAACILILAMASLTTLLLGLRRRVVVRRLDNLWDAEAATTGN